MICRFCTLLLYKTLFPYVFIWSWIPCHWTHFRKFQKVTVYWFTVTIDIMPQTTVKKWRNFGITSGVDFGCVCVCTPMCVHTHKNIIAASTTTSVSVYKYRKYNVFFGILWITTYKFLYKGEQSSSCFRLSVWWKSEKTFQVWPMSTQRILREHKHISYPGKH